MTGLQSLIERMMVWVMMCSFLCSRWMKAADYRFGRPYWQAYGVLHAIKTVAKGKQAV